MQRRPPTIATSRLELIALTADDIRALISCDTDLAGTLVGVDFRSGWPDDPDARAGLPLHLSGLERADSEAAWRVRVIVELASRRVIGSINLKGPPDPDGEVEIGWGVVESWRRRGYATEAAAAVAAWAWAQGVVEWLSATIPDANIPSQRIATKLGLTRTVETRRSLPVWRCPAA